MKIIYKSSLNLVDHKNILIHFERRSRSNHNTGTTETTRSRGNRPRPNLDLVDSSSFRTHQEGPEFPQTLPKGPVRFLGVTPNENNEAKYVPTRENSQKVYEPAPVVESINDTPSSHRRRPASEPAVIIKIKIIFLLNA